MEPEEIEKRANLIVKRCAEECKKLEEYFESEEFNSLISIIKKHERIDHESLLYEAQKIDGLTAENFGRVLESIFHEMSPWIKKDEPGSFPKYYIDYEGIRFHLMIGQGSAYWTTKVK